MEEIKIKEIIDPAWQEILEDLRLELRETA